MAAHFSVVLRTLISEKRNFRRLTNETMGWKIVGICSDIARVDIWWMPNGPYWRAVFAVSKTWIRLFYITLTGSCFICCKFRLMFGDPPARHGKHWFPQDICVLYLRLEICTFETISTIIDPQISAFRCISTKNRCMPSSFRDALYWRRNLQVIFDYRVSTACIQAIFGELLINECFDCWPTIVWQR